jgi:hypothetical protein
MAGQVKATSEYDGLQIGLQEWQDAHMIASQSEMYQAVELQILDQVEIKSCSVQVQDTDLADVKLASVLFKSHVFESDFEFRDSVPQYISGMMEPEGIDSHGGKQVYTVTASQRPIVID